MRVGLAGENDMPAAVALVLGHPAFARPLGQQLEVHGYESVLEWARQRRAPSPYDRDPVARMTEMKDYLADFALEAGRLGSGRSHCVHPGLSPWADRPELAAVCQELGLSVIAPPARVVSLFGNKLNLLAAAEEAGVAHLVQSFDPIHTAREVENLIRSDVCRLPLVLKSVRGEGGFGIFVVRSMEDLGRKFSLWLEQLRRNLGEAMVFPERYVETARRIVVPFVRFKDDEVRVLPMSDASLQTRYRKLVDFCPAGLASGVMDALTERKLREWTREIARKTGYVGVGTLEYFIDGGSVYFLDGFARLGSGFRLWERVTGTKAVDWQLSALEGGPKPEIPVAQPALEALCLRIYTEDPLLQLPQPGKVFELGERREWKFPKASGVLDLAVESGAEVPPPEDGLIGTVHVVASDRVQALRVARGVLDETWIAGSLQTNERFLSELLRHPFVEEGMFHAGFVDEDFLPEVRPSPDLLKLFAAVCASAFGAGPSTGASESRWAVGDQWVRPDASLKWTEGPRFFSEPVAGGQPTGLSGATGVIEVSGGRPVRVCAFPLGAQDERVQKWQVRIGSWTLGVRRVQKSAKRSAEVRILSLLNGTVHSVLYREGAVVPAHEPIVVVEALRTLVPHALPVEVKVVQWCVDAEAQVRAGQLLGRFERLDSTPAHMTG